MSDFKLPDVGEGLTEAEIVTWKVKVGDVIKINDIVVEIETAKSLVELPSPYAGTVQALHVPEGETVPVGTPIITIGDACCARCAGGPGARRRRRSPTPTSGWPRRPVPRRRPRLRSTCRTPLPPAAARTRRWSATAPAPPPCSAVPAAGARAPSTEAGAAAQLQLQGAFGQGHARDRRRRRGRRAPGARDTGRPPRAGRVRRTRAGQAARAQAGQGPRRRPPCADSHRPRRHRHPRGRARSGLRPRGVRSARSPRRPHVRTRRRTAASRSRASAR